MRIVSRVAAALLSVSLLLGVQATAFATGGADAGTNIAALRSGFGTGPEGVRIPGGEYCAGEALGFWFYLVGEDREEANYYHDEAEYTFYLDGVLLEDVKTEVRAMPKAIDGHRGAFGYAQGVPVLPPLEPGEHIATVAFDEPEQSGSFDVPFSVVDCG